MKILFFYILTLLCVSAESPAQDPSVDPTPGRIPDSTFIIERIIVAGNNMTKDFVILREMTLKPGGYLTQQLLEYDQNRIYSLGLFNQVRIRPELSSPGKVLLTVEVSERWYIFPIPIIGIKDRSWSKAYYGLGLLHNNFRGRNEKLYLMLIFGYDKSFSLSYRNPFLTENGSTFLESRLGYYKIRNKSRISGSDSPDFDESHISASLTAGKRIGIEHTAWLSAGYEIVSIPEYSPGRTISAGGTDRFGFLGIGYSYDTRDLYEYPSYGTYFRCGVTKSGFTTVGLNTVRYSADIRRYSQVGSGLVVSGRGFGELSAAGTTPSYSRVYFGYNERIRGHFHEIIEGENLLGFSSELHLTLLEPVYKKIDFMPAEFSILKLGIVAAVFGDAGSAWFRGTPLMLKEFKKGYGFGLHFLLPYSMVLRTEYAFNEIRRGEFIIDIGSMF